MELSMGASEMRFADLIWRSEPISYTVGEALRAGAGLEKEHNLHRAETALRKGNLPESGQHRHFLHERAGISCPAEREFC